MNSIQEPVTQPWAVPSDWEWCHIGNVCDVVSGSTPSTSDNANFDNGEIAWITPADLSGYKKKFIANGARNITERGLSSCSARLLPQGTVLFSSRAPIGYVAVAASPLATNQGFKNFLPSERVKPDYLYYYLQFAKPLAVKLASGTTFQEISGKNAARIPLAVPPLNAQQDIVLKIEELFSDLDAGIAALKRAQANLKRYRAAVLKAAVEGRLTEQWRAERKAKGIATEPAAQLLARILAERRKKWEAAQVKKYADTGKAPPKGWQDKYPEPAATDTSGLPGLPEMWCWTALGHLVVKGPQNGLYLPSSAYGLGIPIMRIDDYQNMWSRSASELRKVNASEAEVSTYALSERDLLINRVNSLTHLGKVLRVDFQHVPAIFESNMMRMSIADCVCVDFFAWYLKAEQGRRRLIKNAKHAVNQASINQQDVLCTNVPLPPLDEQTEIVAQVEAKLSNITQAETEIKRSLERAARLRQAILKRAFEGRLV